MNFLLNPKRIAIMKNQLFVLLIIYLCSGETWAAQYAIQLEASKAPNLEFYRALSIYGNLYTVDTNQGYIRTRLGPYSTRNEAQRVLKQVHLAGFNDAFISKEQSEKDVSSLGLPMPIDAAYNFKVINIKEWKKLTAEQKAGLVSQNGVLHIKTGDTITPLKDLPAK